MSLSYALLLILAFTPPMPSTEPSIEPAPVTGRCQFGRIVQRGRSISITGGERWMAEGEIVNGHCVLTWTWLGNGHKAFGVYDLVEDSAGRRLVGVWSWASDAEVVDRRLVTQYPYSEILKVEVLHDR